MVELWIQKAVPKERRGAYRASVRERYGKRGFTERGTIKREIVRRDIARGGKVGRQAGLATTLRRLRQ